MADTKGKVKYIIVGGHKRELALVKTPKRSCIQYRRERHSRSRLKIGRPRIKRWAN